MEALEVYAARLAGRHFARPASRVASMGGGFYGRVFLAEGSDPRERVVVKLYLYPHLARREALQLQTLSAHATLPMPQVYRVHDADEDVPADALLMSFLPGINAGVTAVADAAARRRIAGQVVDNLLAYHSCAHPEGFGELDDPAFVPCWADFYRPKALAIAQKAAALHSAGELDADTLRTVDRAANGFDRIFEEPVPKACLIHGDYNMWNVLLSADAGHACGVIDPFNCRYADPELDLYQLENANGPDFGLLALYRSRVRLSERFEIKNRFYTLFTEIMHFYDAHVPLKNSAIPQQAAQLSHALMHLGL